MQGGWVPPGLPAAAPAPDSAGWRGGAGERGEEDGQGYFCLLRAGWGEGSYHEGSYPPL